MADVQQVMNLSYMIINQSLKTIEIIANATMNTLESTDRLGEQLLWQSELGKDVVANQIDVGDDVMNNKVAMRLENIMKTNRDTVDGDYIPFKTVNTSQGMMFLVRAEDQDRFKEVVNQVYAEYGIDSTFNAYEIDSTMDPYREFMGVENKYPEYSVDVSMQQAFENALTKASIEYEQLAELDNTVLYAIKDYDKAKVSFVLDAAMASELPGGAVDYSILEAESRNGDLNQRPVIGRIDNLSYDKAKMFEKMAQKADIHINVTCEENSYTVRFCPKDKDAINDMRVSVAVNSMTTEGQLLSQNILASNEIKNDALEKASYGFHDDFVVIDAQSKREIVVDESGIRTDANFYNRDDISYTQAENHSRLMSIMATEVTQFETPIMLTMAEYEQYQNAEDKDQILSEYASKEGYAQIDDETARKISAEREKVDLFVTKINRSRPDQEFIQYRLDDDKMLLSEFNDKELINKDFTEKIELNEELIRKEIDKMAINTDSYVRTELQDRYIIRDEDIDIDVNLEDRYTAWLEDESFADSSARGVPFLDDEIEFGE